jgi:mannose-6-phosphate isomerase-like protein (cupin superfamily)
MKTIHTLVFCGITIALAVHVSPLYSQSQTAPKKSSQVHAQPSENKIDSVVFYTSAEVDKSLKANLAKALKANANSAVAQLGMSKDQAPYLVVARTMPGLVEVHELWDDVAIIRSGHGTLKTGREVTGEKKVTREEPDREWRGGTIEKAEVRDLSPGDFLIIPAMLAHQYIPNKGDTLTYWTVKVKRLRK